MLPVGYLVAGGLWDMIKCRWIHRAGIDKWWCNGLVVRDLVLSIIAQFNRWERFPLHVLSGPEGWNSALPLALADRMTEAPILRTHASSRRHFIPAVIIIVRGILKSLAAHFLQFRFKQAGIRIPYPGSH